MHTVKLEGEIYAQKESISQSLAGRVGHLFLMRLSLRETDIENSDQMMLMGGYPALHEDQSGKTPFAPRCTKDLIEEKVVEIFVGEINQE